MDPRVEAIARALCTVDDLDPEARIADPTYADGLRSAEHREIAQWQAKVPEAARFLAMHEALAAATPSGASETSTPAVAGAGTSL